jgi:hypothetical protein
MSQLKILYLEATEADAESIGSIVNIVREVQSGRTVASVERLAAPLRLVEPAADESRPPPALPAAKRVYKARKPREVKEATAPAAKAHSRAPEGGRATNAAQVIFTHIGKGGKVDKNKLAVAIYGGTEAKQITKVNNMLSYLVRTGKLTKSTDGSYSRVS